MMNAKYNWPDMTKDAKAIELAKTALGWNLMTAEQQMDNVRALSVRAQEIKEAL